jgi:hypothetical protein
LHSSAVSISKQCCVLTQLLAAFDITSLHVNAAAGGAAARSCRAATLGGFM